MLYSLPGCRGSLLALHADQLAAAGIDLQLDHLAIALQQPDLVDKAAVLTVELHLDDLALVLLLDLVLQLASPFEGLRLALLAALAGVLLGMRAIGKRVGLFLRLPDSQPRPASVRSTA